MRNKQIDFLRFLGLSLIILAHCNPSGMIFQLRNFDVPLMVLMSGVSYGLSSGISTGYFEYIWKRIKRLAIPCWIFLTLYFITIKVFNLAIDKTDINHILLSYFFISGIGYVWIIRIFLTVAILAPVISKVSNYLQSDRSFLLAWLGALLIYQLLIQLIHFYVHGGLPSIMIGDILLPTIGYSLVFALGLRLMRFSPKTVFWIATSSLGVFIIYCAYLYRHLGHFEATQNYKSPPGIYYLSYSIALSLISWLVMKPLLKNTESGFIEKIWLFIAQNTLWIYFWHIVFLKIWPFGQFNLLTNYLGIYLAAIVTYLIQFVIIRRFILPRIYNVSLKKNLQSFLIG